MQIREERKRLLEIVPESNVDEAEHSWSPQLTPDEFVNHANALSRMDHDYQGQIDPLSPADAGMWQVRDEQHGEVPL